MSRRCERPIPTAKRWDRAATPTGPAQRRRRAGQHHDPERHSDRSASVERRTGGCGADAGEPRRRHPQPPDRGRPATEPTRAQRAVFWSALTLVPEQVMRRPEAVEQIGRDLTLLRAARPPGSRELRRLERAIG